MSSHTADDMSSHTADEDVEGDRAGDEERVNVSTIHIYLFMFIFSKS